MIIAVTANAELEPGCNHWFSRISTIAQTGGLPIHFLASDLTNEELKKFNFQSTNPISAIYTSFEHWQDFLIMIHELKQNDLFAIVSSRKGYISYNQDLERVPYYLSKYFTNNSYIIIYPKQGEGDQQSDQKEHSDNFILDAIADKAQVVNKAGSYISGIFKKKR